MCESVEMLLRFFAEKLVFEIWCVNVQEKCSHAQLRIFFNGSVLPLASAALYSGEVRL
jgi:hypothetical protein